MADQKNYRKFAASSLAATAAVAAVAPAVSADSVSFTDVQEGDSHYEGIMALAEQGIVDGYADGSFGVYDNVTRQQVAVMLANALDLETPADVDSVLSVYDDVDADSLYAEQIAAVTEAGAFTGNNGKFNPGDDITREQMASVLVSGLSLEEYDNGEDVAINLDNVSPSHADNVQVLANLGLTVATDDFRPSEEISRGAFATMLHGALNPESAAQQITNVSALTDDGHVLEVQFNKPMASLDKSEVSLYETASLDRVGVESVELAADGKSAEIVLYDNTNEDAKDEVERLTEYTIQVGDLETNFTRPEYLDDDENARVTEVDSDERTITVNHDDGKVQLDVPEDMELNFQEALGQEIAVWYDGDDNLQDYQLITREEVVNTAIEVTEKDEIETVDEGTEYDLAENVKFIVNDGAGSDDGGYEVTGQEDVEKELASNNTEFDYAKVIFDDNGDVVRVYAYDLETDPILVEEVDGNIAIGSNSDELDLEDYTIVKDGKQISIDDIEEGDIVFYNEDAYSGDGFAVVGNTTATGSIETIYDDSFVVDGETYDYSNDNVGDVQYLDEDGDFSDLDDDAAEALQSAGDVTLHFNFKGDLVYVTGAVDKIEKEYNSLYLQGEPLPYVDNKGDAFVEIEGVNAEGSNELHDLAIDSLDQITLMNEKGNEVEYEVNEEFPTEASNKEIDEFALTQDGTDQGNLFDIDTTIEKDKSVHIVALDDDGDVIDEVLNLSEYVNKVGSEDEVDYTRNLINLIKDDNGSVKELQFFHNAELLSPGIDEKDSYANGYRLEDDTLVYDVSDANDEYKDPDTEDVSITTWGELKENGVDIDANEATVYADEDGYVTHIVTYNDVISDEDAHTALVTDVQRKDDEIVRVTVLVNGEKVTYDVDNEEDDFVQKDEVVEIEVNAAGDLVTGFNELKDGNDGRLVTDIVKEVSVSDNEIEFENKGTYELVSDGHVYDATDNDADDYSVEDLRDIEAGDKVTIAKPDSSSKFADAVVLKEEDASEVPGSGNVETDGTVTYINAAGNDYKVEVTHEDGSYTTYTEMSSDMNEFFTDHASLLEDNAEVSVTVDEDNRITGIEAIKLLGSETGETAGDLTIPAGAAFDGLTIDGNEKSIDDLTVNADDVTVRDLTVDVLSGNGDSFESIHNTFGDESSFDGNDAEFNTTFEGDMTINGENASLSNVKVENGTLTVSAGASVTVDGETTIQNVDAQGEATLDDVEVTGNVTASGDGSVKLTGATSVDGSISGNVDASEVENEELQDEAQKVADAADIADAKAALGETIKVADGDDVVAAAEAVVEEFGVELTATNKSNSDAEIDGTEYTIDGTDGETATVTFSIEKGDADSDTKTVTFEVEDGDATKLALELSSTSVERGNAVTLDTLDAVTSGDAIDSDYAETAVLEVSVNGELVSGASEQFTSGELNNDDITVLGTDAEPGTYTVTVKHGELEGTAEVEVTTLAPDSDVTTELTGLDSVTENGALFLAAGLLEDGGERQQPSTLAEVKDYIDNKYDVDFKAENIELGEGSISITGELLSTEDWNKVKANGDKTMAYRITLMEDGSKAEDTSPNASNKKVAKIAIYENGDVDLETVE
ncbi:hypothetical protein EU245_12380 [Lentibacillus lipolyticus]|nr:hypothetical protein EU245_12380 [Lentibacillus lipolyticus]